LRKQRKAEKPEIITTRSSLSKTKQKRSRRGKEAASSSEKQMDPNHLTLLPSQEGREK